MAFLQLGHGLWIPIQGDVLPEPVPVHGSATAFHPGCPKSAVEGHAISLVYDASRIQRRCRILCFTLKKTRGSEVQLEGHHHGKKFFDYWIKLGK